MNDLIIDDLCVSYNTTPVLHHFDLHINDGELAVILGPSGRGKSTLLTAVSGLIRPNDGRISFGDTCFFSQKRACLFARGAAQYRLCISVLRTLAAYEYSGKYCFPVKSP